MGSHLEAILGHFFVNFGVRLIVVVDAILGAVVAFWLSFGEDVGIDFWYHLVAFFFRLQMLSSALSWLFVASFGSHFWDVFQDRFVYV